MKNLKFIILISIGLLLPIGCATTPIKTFDLGFMKKTTTVKFESPLFIPVPDDEPQEVKDVILAGLFLFEHSRFDEATDYFIIASERILDDKSNLYKETLMAAAVSSLISGDKTRFIQVMDTINGGLSRFERMSIKDGRWHSLNRIRERLTENIQGGLK